VLARKVKAHLEEKLPAALGALVKAAEAFRPAAEALPKGRARRSFWSAVFADAFVPGAAPEAGTLDRLLAEHLGEAPKAGRVLFVGAGPGDPDDLTMRARRALDEADVVIHDRLVPKAILELARREAEIVEAGKTGFGDSTPQAEINAMIVEHARHGRGRRAAQGRRSGRVRAARRGDRRLRGGGDRVDHRAGADLGLDGRRAARAEPDEAGPQLRSAVPDRDTA
jgi:hypothetical protein